VVTEDPTAWPGDAESLIVHQIELGATPVPRWTPHEDHLRQAGCWVCFPRGMRGPGSAGDPAWASAVALDGENVVERRVVAGAAGAAYRPGLLALRTGRLMEEATRALTARPDLLFVDATARDHPRRSGLALHLGVVLGMPTVGVTHRPLLSQGDWPDDHRGATSPLRIGTEVVASWLRTRPGVRPLVVHPGWQVDLSTAVDLVLAASTHGRTPEPLRQARHAAREARAAAEAAASS
jgi:deoxyribonuclease V